jgi:hypothetical protein
VNRTLLRVMLRGCWLTDSRVLPLLKCIAGGSRARGRQSHTIKNPVDSVDSVDAFAARVDAHRVGESEW